jgi:hypothetical protein
MPAAKHGRLRVAVPFAMNLYTRAWNTWNLYLYRYLIWILKQI